MYSYPVFIFTVVSLLVSINVCLIYYENTLKYKDQILEYYKKNSEIYKSLVDEIRSRQHEYSNRIQTLNTLTVTCKTYEELRGYGLYNVHQNILKYNGLIGAECIPFEDKIWLIFRLEI